MVECTEMSAPIPHLSSLILIIPALINCYHIRSTNVFRNGKIAQFSVKLVDYTSVGKPQLKTTFNRQTLPE